MRARISMLALLCLVVALVAACGAPPVQVSQPEPQPALSRCVAGSGEACLEVLYPEAAVAADAARMVEAAAALGALREQCLAGSTSSCAVLGASLTRGSERWSVDEPGALEAFDRGCALGHGASCAWAGLLVGPRPDLPGGDAELALDYHLRGCELGDGEGCLRAGDLQLSQAAVADARRALEHYRYGCHVAGYGPSCQAAGEVLEVGIVGAIEPEPIAALAAYREGCTAARHGASCAGAAMLWYETRTGMGADDALELTRIGCIEEVDVAACEARGVLLVLAGASDPRALAEGELLLGTACDAERPRACTLLGQLRMATQPERAVIALRMACDTLDYAPACGLLAGLVAWPPVGSTVAADASYAQRVAERACAADDGYGCRVLGQILSESGDAASAQAAFEVGCAAGDEEACRAVDRLRQ